MISVPVGTGDIPCGYDICFTDDIRFAYEGNGYYIIQHSLYIISRKRYITKLCFVRNTWADINMKMNQRLFTLLLVVLFPFSSILSFFAEKSTLAGAFLMNLTFR